MKPTYLTFSLLHLFRLKIVLLIVTRYRQVNLIEERLNAIDRKNMSQMDIWFERETVKFNKIRTLCQILRQTHFQNTTTFHWLLLLPFHSKFYVLEKLEIFLMAKIVEPTPSFKVLRDLLFFSLDQSSSDKYSPNILVLKV